MQFPTNSNNMEQGNTIQPGYLQKKRKRRNDTAPIQHPLPSGQQQQLPQQQQFNPPLQEAMMVHRFVFPQCEGELRQGQLLVSNTLSIHYEYREIIDLERGKERLYPPGLINLYHHLDGLLNYVPPGNDAQEDQPYTIRMGDPQEDDHKEADLEKVDLEKINRKRFKVNLPPIKNQTDLVSDFWLRCFLNVNHAVWRDDLLPIFDEMNECDREFLSDQLCSNTSDLAKQDSENEQFTDFASICKKMWEIIKLQNL